MPRPPAIPTEEKIKLVSELLSGQITICRAAQRAGVSEQAIRNWRKQFVDGGTRNLRGEPACGHTVNEESLLAEIADLKAAIGELYLQLKAHRNRARQGPTFRRINGISEAEPVQRIRTG
ncbi:transposase [Streptomyces sp. ISL-11]|uniref:transposase n=1 Tax=Streptomyces sp. ISL-11 TaxID=2819174 RepID=UPI001BEA31EE|nr:transposase [Streptomyces sp. ISL-11]MBT2386693.1 transposase [Streptomyces sp. ISL-11]